MTWTDVRTHWRPLRDQMQTKWAKLTDADIDSIEGRREWLIEALRERYGLERGEATGQADSFVRSLQVLSL